MFKSILTLLVASSCWTSVLASKLGHSHSHHNPLKEAVSSVINDIKGLGKPVPGLCHSYLGETVTATTTKTPVVTVYSTKTFQANDPDCTTAAVEYRGLDVEDLIKIGPHTHSRYAVESACDELGVKLLPVVTVIKTIVGHHTRTKSVTVTTTVY